MSDSPPLNQPPIVAPVAPFSFENGEPSPSPLPTDPPNPRRRGRLVLILVLSVGLPLLALGGTAGYLVLSGAFADPEPPHLSAVQSERIESEVIERSDLLGTLDAQRDEYNTEVSQWEQSASWAATELESSAQPTPSVSNPGGGAMPGDDPYGRAFLDSIGATDVTVVFEAGPENCGYSGGHDDGYVYAGGCFNGAYPNTLFMAWDEGAEDIVRSIFVHEAMHWYQNEHYLQATYLADFAGIDSSTYNERWEADASCRAVYVYGIPIEDYADSSSPCTINGWYEGFIGDYLASLGAKLTEPDPAAFELVEASRP
ncbi:MAG: hypothetical protein KF761_02455 [Salinibacterium sp.]|nr:hypothetical protein [Salinibacterium sp.]